VAGSENTRTRAQGVAPTTSPAAARAPLPLRALALGAALAPLALALGALAGCGKSGPLSKAEYVKRANAVCRSEKAGMDAVAFSLGNVVQKIDESNQLRAQAGAKLAKLKKPAGNASISEWLGLRASALTIAHQLSLHRTDRAKNRAYVRAQLKAEALARSIGLTNCVGFAAT